MKRFQLGSFEVVERVASGGMGDIWRGVHIQQDLPVAIKVIRLDGADDLRFKQAFRREVRAVAQLDHPAIVSLFDIGDVSAEADADSDGAVEFGSPYLVMEYLERGSLESLKLPLPWHRTWRILLNVLDGLAHAHARGITHRDLKPGNILLADERSAFPARLTDFGIAFSYEERGSTETAGRVVGTPPYMAPEQFMGEWRDFGPWTDLYALGCVAYQLASGRVPFEQTDVIQLGMAHIEQPPPKFGSPADYPDGFDRWVMKLLEKKTSDRYTRCVDAAVALASLVDMSSFPPAQDGVLGTRRGFVTRSFSVPGNDASTKWSSVDAPPMERSFSLIGAGLRLFAFKTVPLVDRDAERDRMWETLTSVSQQGTMAVVVLEGAAGSGKSRLAEWFCHRALEMGLADCLTAKHDRSRGREFGLSSMMAAAWSCLGATPVELQQRVTNVLSNAGIDSQAVHRALTEFLAPAALGDDFSPGMFHEFRSRTARFGVLFEVLRKMHRARPLIVWLDDVHWGTDALQFVRYTVERSVSEPLPMIAVLTVRDDLLVEVPEAAKVLRELSRYEHTTRVQVPSLSSSDTRLLVRNLLYLQGDLAERVSTRSGGNPLYATQLVGDWVNRAILEPGSSGFVLSGRGEPDIPTDVHTIWVQRLERVLDESIEGAGQSSTVVQRISMQVALEIGVALGGRIDMGEWLAVCALAGVPDPGPVLESLLASRMAQGDVGGWSFSHTMFRDAVERISREKRRWPSHNRLCADMLERRRPVPHWGDSERIGRHRFEAAQFELAMPALIRGARERRRIEEYSAALWLLTLYDRALDGLGREENDIHRLEGRLVQADIHCVRRELQEAEDLAKQVRALAVNADARRVNALAVLISARVHHLLGDVQTALSEFSDAQTTLHKTGPKQDLAKCLSERASALLEVGKVDQAWRAFNEAQQLYEDIGQLIPWAENHLGLARVALRQGDIRRSETLCNRVRNFARREQLNRLEAEAWVVLSETVRQAGKTDEAIAALDRGIDLFEQLGLSRQAFHPRALRVLLWVEAGEINRGNAEVALLQSRPDVQDPPSQLLMRCVGLALVADGPAAEFESKIQDVVERVRGGQQMSPEVTRSLRLAAARATHAGFVERAARVNDVLAAVAH